MPAIRRQLNIAAAPRSVWNAFTTAEGWESWYADAARVDAREGGRVVLTTEDDEGAALEEAGIFHQLKPTSRLEIAFDTVGRSPLKGCRLSVQIARDGEETRVALVLAGASTEDEAARAALDATWRRSLTALRDALEG